MYLNKCIPYAAVKEFLLNENKDQVLLIKAKSKSQNKMCSMITKNIYKYTRKGLKRETSVWYRWHFLMVDD